MDKSFLIEQLGARMREAVQSTHQAAREASQDARSGAARAVNLAKGQLQRSTSAREALDALDSFRVRPFKRGEAIGLGSVVDIESDDGGRTLFLAPVGAGQELTGPGGDGFFHVVTPVSPIGRALMGKHVGDVIEVALKGPLQRNHAGALGDVAEWTITDAA